MSKIIGITVGTPINHEKISNEKEIEEIKASLGDIDTALDELSNEIMPSETYDFKNAWHDYGYSRLNFEKEKGDIITIFVPMGWYVSTQGVPLITITATEKDEVYKFTVDENTDIYFFDAGLSSYEDFDPSDCPVIITKARNRLEDIEAQMGDIDAALDELHAYAQALISGGDAQ